VRVSNESRGLKMGLSMCWTYSCDCNCTATFPSRLTRYSQSSALWSNAGISYLVRRRFRALRIAWIRARNRANNRGKHYLYRQRTGKTICATDRVFNPFHCPILGLGFSTTILVTRPKSSLPPMRSFLSFLLSISSLLDLAKGAQQNATITPVEWKVLFQRKW